MDNLSVFIVDDDDDFAESLAMVLESRGCQVEIAASGEEAIEIFRTKNFDIAFMDVKLPGKNGVESFLEIRQFKPEARVVMMTGYSVEQLLDQAVAHGAWGILRKPICMEDLLEIVEKLPSSGILIADDDPDFIESIKDLLESGGKKVLVASNGHKAVKCVLANHIDLLILDIRMPILNGLQTYLELKRLGRQVPTIIVTAYASEESEALRRLESLSIDGILKKPFDPRKFLREVESLIK